MMPTELVSLWLDQPLRGEQIPTGPSLPRLLPMVARPSVSNLFYLDDDEDRRATDQRVAETLQSVSLAEITDPIEYLFRMYLEQYSDLSESGWQTTGRRHRKVVSDDETPKPPVMLNPLTPRFEVNYLFKLLVIESSAVFSYFRLTDDGWVRESSPVFTPEMKSNFYRFCYHHSDHRPLLCGFQKTIRTKTEGRDDQPPLETVVTHLREEFPPFDLSDELLRAEREQQLIDAEIDTAFDRLLTRSGDDRFSVNRQLAESDRHRFWQLVHDSQSSVRSLNRWVGLLTKLVELEEVGEFDPSR